MSMLPPSLNLEEIWDAHLPPLDFVLPGLLSGTVGLLVAPGATGKSFFSLQVASAIAGGPDLLQQGISRHGRVLLIAAEDPPSILANRLQAMGAHATLAMRENLLRKLDIVPALSLGIELFGEGAPKWEASIAERGKDCRLIVIDTLSRIHSGEENSREDASRVMRRLERIAAQTGAAVLVLHHVGKAAALNGQGDLQQAARGASVWVDEARWVAFLRTMDNQEAAKAGVNPEVRKDFVRYGVSKANYSTQGMDIWLQRDMTGLLLPTQTQAKPRNLIAIDKTASRRWPGALSHIAEAEDDNAW